MDAVRRSAARMATRAHPPAVGISSFISICFDGVCPEGGCGGGSEGGAGGEGIRLHDEAVAREEFSEMLEVAHERGAVSLEHDARGELEVGDGREVESAIEVSHDLGLAVGKMGVLPIVDAVDGDLEGGAFRVVRGVDDGAELVPRRGEFGAIPGFEGEVKLAAEVEGRGAPRR
jgi:hypothetical protein